MVVLNEILGKHGGIELLRRCRSVRVELEGRRLLLEYLGDGPTGQAAMRLLKINYFGEIELEMHLEWRGDFWMPYYLRSEMMGTELFLYRFLGIREPLQPDFEAGARLIQLAGCLDLQLWAEGFARAADDSQYHPLFGVEGGAA